MLVSFHMDGPAMIWFQDLEEFSGLTSWEAFTRALMICIGPSSFDGPMAQFKKLKLTQTSSVVHYKTQFEYLSNRLRGIDEFLKLSCFLEDLREEIELPLRLLEPRTLAQAYGMANIEEKHLFNCRKFSKQSYPSPPSHNSLALTRNP